MNPTHQKVVVVTPPAAIVDAASLTTAAIDTLGFGFCTILVILGATDVAMTALKVQQSDASGSGFADVTGLDYSAALPGAGADNTVYAFDVDLKGKKRYLDVVATGGDGAAGAYFTVIAILSKAQQLPTTATQRGLAATLAV